jgi:hypothetical protein
MIGSTGVDGAGSTTAYGNDPGIACRSAALGTEAGNNHYAAGGTAYRNADAGNAYLTGGRLIILL